MMAAMLLVVGLLLTTHMLAVASRAHDARARLDAFFAGKDDAELGRGPDRQRAARRQR